MFKKQKKHSFEDRLKYMKMIEAGYSINYIHTHFGISHGLLESLWLQYQIEGESSLIKKKNIKADGDYRERVVRDIEEKHITLQEAAVKYDVSVARICAWKKIVKEQGYDGLHKITRGRPQKDMGRPKKKKPEEMTELERLRYENERLRAENALLKKVRALVEEREARLREIGRKPSKN